MICRAPQEVKVSTPLRLTVQFPGRPLGLCADKVHIRRLCAGRDLALELAHVQGIGPDGETLAGGGPMENGL